MTITKGERDELRRIVRQDFKVLAEEMKVRRAEMVAEIEQRVAQRFEPSDQAAEACQRQMGDIIQNANEAITKAIADLKAAADGYMIAWNPLATPRLFVVPEKREEMRRALIADLDARIAEATLRVHRQEADLLKGLASGALESDAAREFLASIPTVAQLVPADRLAELEAQFSQDDDT